MWFTEAMGLVACVRSNPYTAFWVGWAVAGVAGEVVALRSDTGPATLSAHLQALTELPFMDRVALWAWGGFSAWFVLHLFREG